MHRWKTILSCTILATALLVRFIVLPEFLRSHISKAVTDGSLEIGNISISLFSASFALHDVALTNADGEVPFRASLIHVGLDIAALKAGHWLSQIKVHEPAFVLTAEMVRTSFPSELPSWVRTIGLLPVNQIYITGGTAQFNGAEAGDPVITISDIGFLIRNLENVSTSARRLPAVGRATGRIEEAMVFIDLEVDAKSATPLFNITAKVRDLNLLDVQKYLNDMGIRGMPQGLLTIYTEAGSMKNRVIGYVKQELEGVVAVSASDKQQLTGFPGKRIIKTLDEVYFHRDLIHSKINVWNAIGYTLHSAFIQSVSTLAQEHAGTQPPTRRAVPHGKPKRKTSLASYPVTPA